MILRWLAAVLLCAFVAARLWIGERLEVGHWELSATEGLLLDDLVWHSPPLRLRCRRVQWLIRPAALWQGRLHIARLSLEGIEGSMQASTGSPRPALPWPDIPAGWSLRVDALSLNELSWQGVGTTEPLRLQRLGAAFSLDRNGLQVDELTLDNPSLWLQSTGNWQVAADAPLMARLAWRVGPPASPQWAGQGTLAGNDRQLHIEQTLTTPAPVNLSGDVHLQPDGPHGSARLTLPPVPLNRLRAGWPDWPVQATLELKGQPMDIQADLHATLQQHPVRAVARLGVASKRLDIHQFELTAADTRLALHGHYADTLALDWTLRVARLGALLDGARGWLDGRGQLRGTPTHPAIDLETRGGDLALGEQTITRLELKARSGLETDAPLELRLNLAGARPEAERFELALGVRGTARRHTLEGHLTHPRHSLRLDGQGGWQGQAWQGVLQHLDLTDSPWGRWNLTSPARLMLARTGFNLDEACWRSGTALGCAAGQGQTLTHWSAKGRLDGLPLARLLTTTAPPLALGGILAGQASLTGSGSRIDTGQFSLAAKDLALSYPLSPPARWQFRPTQALLTGTIDPGMARLRLALHDPLFASLDGDLSARRVPGSPLSGQFRLNLPDLAVLEPPPASQEPLIQGQGQWRLEVSGTARAPRWAVEGGIHQARLNLPALGIRLTGMELAVQPVLDQPNHMTLTARAEAGAGHLALTGNGWLDPARGWPWEINLSGEKAEIANTRLARVTLTPRLKLAGGPTGLHLSGQARIPYARIGLPDHPVVKVSDDTVRVDQPAETARPGLSLQSEIQLELGEDVRFEGSGVKARLGGQLQLKQTRLEPGLAQGEIRIEEGDYSFHGVRLPLKGGRLIYRQTPLDNPELDFNVVREVNGVRAGIRVLGPLQNPGFTLHADPAMPESDILAYLISGKSLNLSTRQDGQRMQQAAASLGGPLGNLLLQEVTGRFGLEGLLDDVAVQTRPGTQGAALFLGKYLTPRLYLQYGVGLAQSTNVFRIRYELGKHWKIQSETGEQSGGDLLFELEK